MRLKNTRTTTFIGTKKKLPNRREIRYRHLHNRRQQVRRQRVMLQVRRTNLRLVGRVRTTRVLQVRPIRLAATTADRLVGMMVGRLEAATLAVAAEGILEEEGLLRIGKIGYGYKTISPAGGW